MERETIAVVVVSGETTERPIVRAFRENRPAEDYAAAWSKLLKFVSIRVDIFEAEIY